MTHFLHTQADLEAGARAADLAGPALQAGRREGRRLRAAPPRGGLCRAVRHRLRPAAFDRERRGDPRPAVRRLRSVPSRHGAARAHRQAQAARPVRAEDQVDQGNRQGDRQGPHRPRRGRQHGGRRGARGADRAARHRAVDRRHLSACSASATPTPGRPAISPCRRRRASPSACASGRTPRRWPSWPRPGGRGAAWRRICCGPIITR